MTRWLPFWALLAACEPAALTIGEGGPPRPGEGWVGEPLEQPDTAAPEVDLSAWDGARLVVRAPEPGAVLLRGEQAVYEALVVGAGGAEVPQSEVAFTWASDTDPTFFLQQGVVETAALGIGDHVLSVTASLPNGDRLATAIPSVRVQDAAAGHYVGTFTAQVGAQPFQCDGTLALDVPLRGGSGDGTGTCTITVFGNPSVLDWRFLPTLEADGSVGGEVRVDGLGLLTLTFTAEGTLDPDGAGFDVAFHGEVPLLGEASGTYTAVR